ncbi:AlbA family DNA-binding domain-containing protein [Paramagnetospirillum marisnigri]|uniref:AlbA family DNA-binding domain-containing protein n=1 Tax=Paramagnetospirillum marisnigri TaxID=1285242 RepID=UPI0009ED897D|nr:ATP-binding protein [Paramagnetospirillum marisnigri]
MSELLELNIDHDTLRVTNRESEHREFKLSFDMDKIWKYAQTIAAFANRDGGVIFFGIKNSPKELVGVSGAEPEDLVVANFLKEYFEPEIQFIIGSKVLHDRKVLYILVSPSGDKPVICKKKKVQQFREKGKADQELLREGAVYYRYSSSNGEIKHPELRKILDERVQRVFHSLVDNITLINKVGHDRVAIVDAAGLSGDDKTATVYITTETAKNMNWIRKGRFSETENEAEKAFYVVREVEIKHGVEIEKPIPTDPAITHPLTKTALIKAVGIGSNYIDAILWKLGLSDNKAYHFKQSHGKSMFHKFTENARDEILKIYPLNMSDRKNAIKKTHVEYSAYKANTMAEEGAHER